MINPTVAMKNIYAIFLLILISGCRTNFPEQAKHTRQELGIKIPIREHSVQSVLWVQQSGEYRALCYQAFNLAKYQLDDLLSKNEFTGKPLAIITDIDETIFNNSPFAAKQIETDKEFNQDSWVQWEKLEQAKSIPGSLEFLKYAESKGVQVFYISNISVLQQKETMNHLKKIGFPYVDEKHMLLKDKTSGKEVRRQIVSKENTIVMLLGDTLSDFSDVFDDKSTNDRNNQVENFRKKFGKEFIVLPNPTYGDWETKGIYEGNYKWSAVQKDSIRKVKLISY
tara:strand:- start:23369 stop:24214 length:846 start_codon:yes stop_codon:yes gene_type:complete